MTVQVGAWDTAALVFTVSVSMWLWSLRHRREAVTDEASFA